MLVMRKLPETRQAYEYLRNAKHVHAENHLRRTMKITRICWVWDDGTWHWPEQNWSVQKSSLLEKRQWMTKKKRTRMMMMMMMMWSWREKKVEVMRRPCPTKQQLRREQTIWFWEVLVVHERKDCLPRRKHQRWDVLNQSEKDAYSKMW